MRLKKFFFLALIITPSVFLVLAIYSRRERVNDEAHRSPKFFAEHQKEIVAEWGNYVYVALKSTNQIRDGIGALISSNSNQCHLSDHQEQMLEMEFADFFNAYSIGTYESYCIFRLPPHVSWNWKTNGCGFVTRRTGAKEELDRYFHEGPNFLITKFMYIFLTNSGYFPTHKLPPAPETMEARFRQYVFLFSDCTFFSNFWVSVNFDRSKLILTKTRVAPPPLFRMPFYPIQKPVAATVDLPFPNLGSVGSGFYIPTLIEFDNSMANILNSGQELLTADAFFFVNPSEPDSPIPVLIRLYWSPADDRWLPDELDVGTIQSLAHRYPIF